MKHLSLISNFLLVSASATMLLTSSAWAEKFVADDADDVDEEGRTFLFDQPLEGVYSNGWTGMRVGGNGTDDTDIHIRADGKLPFEGVVTIFCGSSGEDWKLGGEEAEYSVPSEVLSSARNAFCNR